MCSLYLVSTAGPPYQWDYVHAHTHSADVGVYSCLLVQLPGASGNLSWIWAGNPLHWPLQTSEWLADASGCYFRSNWKLTLNLQVAFGSRYCCSFTPVFIFTNRVPVFTVSLYMVGYVELHPEALFISLLSVRIAKSFLSKKYTYILLKLISTQPNMLLVQCWLTAIYFDHTEASK